LRLGLVKFVVVLRGRLLNRSGGIVSLCVAAFGVVSGYGEASVTVMVRMCATTRTVDSYACSDA